MRLSFYYPPARFFYARKYFNNSINILDIGCANDSPQVTKKWFPSSTYHGADIVKTLNPCIDSFYLMTANEYSGYEDIQNGFYDFVILNHVIEHLEDPSTLIKIACSKLRPGGLLWIAFPSVSSLNFPSGVGTLNFSDDSSHIYVVNIIDLSNQIISDGLKIIRAGKSSDRLRFIIGLLLFPIAFLTRLFKGKYMIKGLWYLYGFEDRILARRPNDS